MTTLTAWILNLILTLQPSAPWSETYGRTAEAIARVSEASPVFAGEDGPARTAAMLVALAWFESSFRPDAAGDCDRKQPNGMCAPGGRPRSFCLFQIGESNFAALGVTREQVQTDVDVCADAAIRMVRISFQVCRARPLEDRLGHYASGGSSCDGVAASRNRIRKGMWLFRSTPPPALR